MKLKFAAIALLILLMNVNIFASDLDDTYNPAEEVIYYIPLIQHYEPLNIEVDSGTEDQFDVLFKNVNSADAVDVFFTVNGSNKYITVDPADRSYSVTTIQGMNGYKLPLNIKTSEDTPSGVYPINISYTYNNVKDSSYSGNATVNLRVNGKNDDVPMVYFTDFTNSQVKNGDNFTVTGNLKNIKGEAKNVEIKIGQLEANTLKLESDENIVYFEALKENEALDFSFDFSTYKNLTTGVYPVTYTATYLDTKNEQHTSEYVDYISVENTASKNDLTLESSTITSTLSPENTFPIDFSLTNTGTNKIEDITLTATPKDGTIVPISADIINIDALETGETLKDSFKFMVDKSATTKNYIIEILATYTYNDEIIEKKSYANINVNNPDSDEEEKDSKKSTPKIMVSEYSISPDVVYAGTPFKLTMSFLNTSNTRSVKNIKISLGINSEDTETGNIFVPVNGSNSLYIENIGTNSTVTRDIELQPDYNAAAKNYDILVTIDYEDEDNNSYTQTEVVGIKVNQIIKLDYGEMTAPEFLMVGDAGNVNFQFYNTGKVALNNLKMSLTSDNPENFDFKEAEYYYGKFEIGSQEYYDVPFFAYAPGEYNMQVLISYEDENGKKLEETKDFPLIVEEMVPDESFDETMIIEEIPQKTFPTGLIVATVGVLLVIFSVIVLKVKKGKKKAKDGYYE
ncbi:MAG: COG1361 S-layer family protein [Lachnospirales bacterium]